MEARTIYYQLRHEYRLAKRMDNSWRPDPYRSTQQLQARPNTAGELLQTLSPRLRKAVEARPLQGSAPVSRGSRSSWYANWRPSGGPGSGMTLYQRVALRRAQREIRARNIERMINPAAIEYMMVAEGLRQSVEQLEAIEIKLAAMDAYRKHEFNKHHGLPY